VPLVATAPKIGVVPLMPPNAKPQTTAIDPVMRETPSGVAIGASMERADQRVISSEAISLQDAGSESQPGNTERGGSRALREVHPPAHASQSTANKISEQAGNKYHILKAVLRELDQGYGKR
jgi:hypothetical protein